MTTFKLDLSWNVSAAHPEAEAGLGAVLCNVTPSKGAERRAACVGCPDVNVSTIFPSPLFISPIASHLLRPLSPDMW